MYENEIEEDDKLRIKINQLRSLTFFNSNESELTEYQINVIIKDNLTLQNIIENTDKFKFIKGVFVVKELLIPDTNLQLLSENINKLIEKLSSLNIETLVLLDIENIVFSKGNYNLKSIIGNLNFSTEVDDGNLIKLHPNCTFDKLESMGCEEIICDINFDKFKSLKFIYGWLIDKKENLYTLEQILPLVKTYNFHEFNLNNFIPCSLLMDLELSDSEYERSLTSSKLYLSESDSSDLSEYEEDLT